MRLLTVTLITILPLVYGAKELFGEELPSKEDGLVEDETAAMVKRSVGNIAARRRSALDKNFMRFGRSDPDMSPARHVRAKPDFMRFGRSPANFMRFGRAGNANMMRFGRASGANMMRFGRAGANSNMMRFGRANMMRFGRANMMRFGRAGSANMMRFGRSSSDNDDANDDVEIEVPTFDVDDLEELAAKYGRPANDGNGNKKNTFYDDSFMHFGRMTTDNPVDDADIESLFQDENRKKRSTQDRVGDRA